MTEQSQKEEVIVIDGQEYPMRAVSLLYNDIAETLLAIVKEMTLRGWSEEVIKERCLTAATCAAKAYLVLIPKKIRSRPVSGVSN